jgi:chromosome partitioning protein
MHIEKEVIILKKWKNGKAKIISFINMKGGVGKTTLAVNLTLEIPKMENKRILVVDIDPQFNTTQSLLNQYNLLDKYFDFKEEKKTIVTVFERKKKSYLTGAQQIDEEVLPIIDLDQNISIIPGDLDLTNEIEATRAERLKTYLVEKGLIDIYDLIFIDCPPTWSLYSQAALKASHSFIVPSRIDEFSLYGIKILLDKVYDILPSNNDLRCLGVVYTMISETRSVKGINRKQSENKKKIEDFFEELKKEKAEILMEPFTTTTSFYDRLSFESVVYNEYTEKKPEIYTEIKDLAKEFLSRL